MLCKVQVLVCESNFQPDLLVFRVSVSFLQHNSTGENSAGGQQRRETKRKD
jgi:hypothetical protein